MGVFKKMQWPGRTRAPFETASEKNSVKPRDSCWGAGWAPWKIPRMFHQQFMKDFLPLLGFGEVWGIFPGYVGKIIERVHLPSTRSFLPFSRARFRPDRWKSQISQNFHGDKIMRSQKRSPEMGLRWRKCLDSLTKFLPSKHLTFGFQSVFFFQVDERLYWNWSFKQKCMSPTSH